MIVDVSVIIPCRNEGKTIRLLLEALKDQTYPIGKTEIIIADGMSEDDTRTQISAFVFENPEMQIRVVDNPQKIIPAALNNAIHASTGSMIVRMDAHAIPRKDYIERCVRALNEGLGENVGGAWDIRPQADTQLAKAIAAAAAHPLAVGDASYRHAVKAEHVDTVPFGAFKRELLEQVGMFDESLLTNEDYELNTRIRKNGGRIWLDPEIRSVYFARRNLADLGRQYWRYGFWKSQMIKRYPKTLRLRQALPPIFVGGVFLLAFAAIFWKVARILLLIGLGLYTLGLLSAGIQLAIKEKQFSHIIFVPPAIATMHFTWGTGFIRGFFIRPLKRTT